MVAGRVVGLLLAHGSSGTMRRGSATSAAVASPVVIQPSPAQGFSASSRCKVSQRQMLTLQES